MTLDAVLAPCLSRHEVPWADGRIEIKGNHTIVRRVWEAFCEFAALPVEDLAPGLAVPQERRRDADRLTFGGRFPQPEPATGPVWSPRAWLTRRIYPVDAAGAWGAMQEAGLRFVFDEQTQRRGVMSGALGTGGPGADRAAAFFTRVGTSRLGWVLIAAEHLDHVVPGAPSEQPDDEVLVQLSPEEASAYERELVAAAQAQLDPANPDRFHPFEDPRTIGRHPDTLFVVTRPGQPDVPYSVGFVNPGRPRRDYTWEVWRDDDSWHALGWRPGAAEIPRPAALVAEWFTEVFENGG